MKRLWADPFERANRFLNFLETHLFQKDKTDFLFTLLDPMKDFVDAPRLLFSQPSRSNC